MPNFNKDRIFNGSPTKVLRREYDNLKQNFTKLNAMKYKQLYENASLSFILENSRYIFSEPYRGLDFYKIIMENAILPFGKLSEEISKVEMFVSEHGSQMSDTQKDNYDSLLESMHNRESSMYNSTHLYENIMENVDAVLPLYDAVYEYTKDPSSGIPTEVEDILESSDINILDVLNISLGIPEIYSETVEYLNESYVENPHTPEDYLLNTYTTNIISRMMRDSYFSEKVCHLSNVNLRHLIMGLGGVKGSEMVDAILIEKVVNYNPMYSNGEFTVNQVFEDDIYSEIFEESCAEEKRNRLLCEKAVIDMNLSFMAIDFMSSPENERYPVNSIVEKLCVESETIEKIPQDGEGQMKLMKDKSDKIESELKEVNEKYFLSDGSPSKVVASSIGGRGSDDRIGKKDDEKEYQTRLYSPKKVGRDNDEDEDDDESDDDDYQARKREEAKRRRDDKYSRMNIDDVEFDSLTESNESDEDEESDKKRGLFRKKEKYQDVEKPEKKPFFQRVQNKALDTNVKFKKTVANGKRTAQDARNAGKAVAKVPMNIVDSIKKTIGKWDEMDDDRRKEYIIKPGTRKKYFKALQIAIMHWCAWAINPLLNIVLLICHSTSAKKDERIKNELIKELKTEIKVTEEKIEDAKSAGDKEQKYKLMRIKEKLDAELTRVGTNAKFI